MPQQGDRRAPVPASATSGMSRAAIMLLGASLALAGTACGGPKPADPPTSPAPEPGPPDDDGAVMAEYGAPAPAPEPAPEPGPPDDDGGTMAKYGAPAPPPDTGNTPSDPGGAVALYGAPAVEANGPK